MTHHPKNPWLPALQRLDESLALNHIDSEEAELAANVKIERLRLKLFGRAAVQATKITQNKHDS